MKYDKVIEETRLSRIVHLFPELNGLIQRHGDLRCSVVREVPHDESFDEIMQEVLKAIGADEDKGFYAERLDWK